MPLLFSIALFVSAFLLFLVQPMVGRMITPKLGGTPAVWNACMVFFQAALLAGYGYAHLATAWLGSRRQAILHLVVLALPAVVLPIVISEEVFQSSAAVEHPVLLVLKLLAMTVGLPFFVVSTTGPLLQRWFADTGHPSSRDPYFLYAASNLGSMLALLAYPLLVEPVQPLRGQSHLWSWGYVLYAGLVVACGVVLWLRKPESVVLDAPIAQTPAESITWKRRARWVFLAFVPSSLLLGSTTFVSTDIAPIPLLWVIPLALYLLTFILVFAKRRIIPHRLACRWLPIAVLALTLVLLTGATELRGLPVAPLLGLHLLVFFLAALVGHGEMADDRPSAGRLTEFYVWMSVGGVLGGLFNALLAPIIFQRTGLTEYPLALVLACILRPMPVSKNDKPAAGLNAWDFVLPVLLGLLAVGLILGTEKLGLSLGPVRTGIMFGLPCILAFTLVDRPVRFALGIAALMLAGLVKPDQELLYIDRNFFGVVKVANMRDTDGNRFRALFHGNTIHGQQRLDHADVDGRAVPLTYYHPSGPIGTFCTTWLKDRAKPMRVAGVGLGTGSIAYYARPGDTWVFYEIDPAIQHVAEDPRYFSFMSDCRAGKPKVILGDARLKLKEAEDAGFDLVVLDAFSSDSIPMHLLTKEAFELYKLKLAAQGVIALHVSNRYLNLWPIVAKLAEDAGLVVRGWRDQSTNKDLHPGKSDSEWLILARAEADFGPTVWPRGMKSFPDPRWELVKPKPNTPLWKDDFSNLLSAFGRDEE